MVCPRSVWLLAPLVLGCNSLWGIDELVVHKRPNQDAAGGAGEGGLGVGGGSGSAGGGVAGAGGEPASGGNGGAPPFCGDGEINGFEQCDDGALVEDDGCSAACQVECGGAAELMDPTTLHCYWLNLTQLEWATASAACVVWHGTLASITSDEERLFVEPSLTSNTWIGGNDLITDGTFVWENGEPWVYEQWDAGSPAAPPNGQDCVVLETDASFEDTGCGSNVASLCERATGL